MNGGAESGTEAQGGEAAPLVVAITGATGVVYGIRLLEILRDREIPTILVMTEWGAHTIKVETNRTPDEVRQLAGEAMEARDSAAVVADPSFKFAGTIVAPCSMKTLAAIAHGVEDNLVDRVARTTLEGHHQLVLLVRESPLSVIHLENMLIVAKAGAVVAPPVPSFYTRPSTLENIVDDTVGRMLDLLHIDRGGPRWGESFWPSVDHDAG
jgi:flavin prenyltransferase